MAPLTLHLSLTSSPSSPRVPLVLDDGGPPVAPAELRRRAAAATSVPLASLKLIFRGRVVPDKEEGDVVREFRLEEGSVVHVMGRPAAAAAPAPGGSAAGSAAAGASMTLPPGGAPPGAGGGGGGTPPLDAALARLRSSNPGAAYRTALATADKLLGNVVNNPMEEKYRTIKKSNPAFSRRLGDLPGGPDLLLAAGFVVDSNDGAEYYVLRPSEAAWPRLVAAREGARRALEEHDSSSGSAAPPVVPGNAGAAGAGAGSAGDLLGGLSNLCRGGLGGGAPDMAAVQNMLSDPNMVQNVMNSLNNPMIQNMMRSDPRLANNPMLQQSLDALRSNPEMISQFSRMMSDPSVRDRMSNMMSQQPPAAGGGAGAPPGGGPEAMRRQMEQFQRMAQQFGGSSGGFGAGGGGAGGGGGSSTGGVAGQGGASAGGASDGAGTGGAGAGGSDGEMTEEEMIAEAIRRSMAE